MVKSSPSIPPESKKQVSEILHRVDALVKSGELARAREELDKAKQVDPRNVYIFAFEERLNSLEEERKRAEIEAEIRKAEEENRRRLEEERRRLEEQHRRQEEQRRREERARQEQLAREQEAQRQERARLEAEQKAFQEAARQQEEQEQRRLEEQLRAAAVQLSPKVSHAEALRAYREALIDVWADGAATEEEKLTLLVLRASLSISPEEHNQLESEAQRESYYKALKRAWAAGTVTAENARVLSELRERFKITQEEHDAIEARLLAELRQKVDRATIFVIDDEEKLLKFLSDILTEAGFTVRTFSTTDDAYASLQQTVPDLILSDINLETSTMGGFTFYEKVRAMKSLQHVPFIFLSGLNDEILIRAGKELGVDDYLTKPFAEETLIATIRGKIKRARQLREAAQRS